MKFTLVAAKLEASLPISDWISREGTVERQEGARRESGVGGQTFWNSDAKRKSISYSRRDAASSPFDALITTRIAKGGRDLKES